MNDLEMTRLAAEAVGHTGISENKNGLSVVLCDGDIFFDPLHDPAQAFELQEKLRMLCMVNIKDEWVCKTTGVVAVNIDIKRAIVECAARYALWKREQSCKTT